MYIYMHVCTYTHLYIHIYFSCGPLKHQRVMSWRRNQVFRTSKRSLQAASLVTPSTSYGNVKIGKSQVK